jgi:hypothetical protein
LFIDHLLSCGFAAAEKFLSAWGGLHFTDASRFWPGSLLSPLPGALYDILWRKIDGDKDIVNSSLYL